MAERRTGGSAAFTFTLLALVALMAGLTFPPRSGAFLIPALVIVPTAVLLAMQLALDWRQGPGRERAQEGPAIARAMAWLLLMPALLAVAGLAWGGALYAASYLYFRSDAGPRAALVAGLATGAGIWLLAGILSMPQLLYPALW